MSEEFKAKRYACTQWPFLRIGKDIQFEAGFYTARTKELADMIEANEAFGKHIYPIKWEPKPVPTQPGKVETLIESEIAEALAEKAPRARRGAVGTRG